jgi:hypothetical protein
MLIALLVIAGLATITLLAICVLLHHSMQKEVVRLRGELSTVLSAGEPVRRAGESQLRDDIHHQVDDSGMHVLTPEALSEVAATLSAFLGTDVRISAVADAPVPNGAHHAWAQQGCVAIQNSHDLATAKHVVSRPQVSVRRHVA